MFKRAKFYILLGIIVASTLGGLFSFPQTAGAQTSSGVEWDDKRIINSIKAQAYRDVMVYCITSAVGGGVRNPIGFDNARSHDWFQKLNISAIDAGYLADPKGDGKLSCPKEVVTEFLKIFGWSDPIQALCALGYRPAYEDKDGTFIVAPDCSGIGGTGTITYEFLTFPEKIDVKSTVTAGINSSPNVAVLSVGGTYQGAPQWYLVQKLAYINKCSSTAESGAQNLPVQTVYWDVQAASGTTESIGHPVHSDGGKKVMIFPGSSRSCDELAEQVQGKGDAAGNAQAYIDWLTDHNPSSDQNAAGDTLLTPTSENKSTCQIAGIGWIVCPVLKVLGSIADESYNLLDSTLLRLAPVNMNFDDNQNGLYQSWSVMRNLANIAFVIAFLFIVFSQITNIGINNYGIKRLVPKLIMAAILVNLSYMICAVAIDVSNILGSGIKGLLDYAGKSVAPNDHATGLNSGNTWAQLIDAALAATVVIGVVALNGPGKALEAGWALIGLAMLIIVPIILTVFITMIIRQAFIILLVVVSPLAFVTLLLPNTEGYFKKWQELFKALLLLYPIVAIMFSGAKLASTILMASSDNTFVQVTAALTRVLPLLFIPALMKVSSGVFGRVTGMVNDTHKGFFDTRRNSIKEGQAVRSAERKARVAGFVNPTDANGNPIPQSRRQRVFKRAVGVVTGSTNVFGSNGELERKDRMNTANSNLEAAYLNNERGRNTRAAADNTQISLQNAKLRADTIRIESNEGLALKETATELEKRKNTAENIADARGLQALVNNASGQDVLEREKNSELTKVIAENRVATVATQRASDVLEGLAQETGKDKKAAEDRATAQGLSRVSDAALGRAKDAESIRQGAESDAAARGANMADRSIAAQAEDAALQEKTAASLLARDVAPLVSQANRIGAHEAEMRQGTAESEAETRAIKAFNSSASGEDALKGSEDAKNAKQIESDNSQAIGIAGADKDLKVRATTSSEALSAIQGQDKQLYEEIIAGVTPAGISPSTIADAKYARETATVTREATARAQGVSDDALATKVLNDPALAKEMGGVDPNGPLAARTRAANSLTQSHSEAVNNYLSLLRRERRTGTDSMGRLPTLNGAEMEANAVNVAKYGADEDIIDLLNYAGSLPAGDARKVSILQQYADNVGNRNPPAIGQKDFELIRNGKWVGDIASSWRERTESGSFSGTKAAAMSKALLKSQHDALNTTLTPAERAGLEKYVDSIIEYRNDMLIKQPEAKITEEMDRIVRLVHPTWTADPRP